MSLYLTNGHLETIVPSAFRTVKGVIYQRQRLELSDGDFLDLDWLRHNDVPMKKLVIISHGLEGSSERHYSRGWLSISILNGWDALAWNCRSCSGETQSAFEDFITMATRPICKHVIDEAYRKEYDHLGTGRFQHG